MRGESPRELPSYFLPAVQAWGGKSGMKEPRCQVKSRQLHAVVQQPGRVRGLHGAPAKSHAMHGTAPCTHASRGCHLAPASCIAHARRLWRARGPSPLKLSLKVNPSRRMWAELRTSTAYGRSAALPFPVTMAVRGPQIVMGLSAVPAAGAASGHMEVRGSEALSRHGRVVQKVS